MRGGRGVGVGCHCVCVWGGGDGCRHMRAPCSAPCSALLGRQRVPVAAAGGQVQGARAKEAACVLAACRARRHAHGAGTSACVPCLRRCANCPPPLRSPRHPHSRNIPSPPKSNSPPAPSNSRRPNPHPPPPTPRNTHNARPAQGIVCQAGPPPGGAAPPAPSASPASASGASSSGPHAAPSPTPPSTSSASSGSSFGGRRSGAGSGGRTGGGPGPHTPRCEAWAGVLLPAVPQPPADVLMQVGARGLAARAETCSAVPCVQDVASCHVMTSSWCCCSGCVTRLGRWVLAQAGRHSRVWHITAGRALAGNDAGRGGCASAVANDAALQRRQRDGPHVRVCGMLPPHHCTWPPCLSTTTCCPLACLPRPPPPPLRSATHTPRPAPRALAGCVWHA